MENECERCGINLHEAYTTNWEEGICTNCQEIEWEQEKREQIREFERSRF